MWKMKDSGIAWIGEIPETWKVRRGKILFMEKKELSSNGKEELLTVSHITGVTPRSQKNVNMFLATSLVGYKICKVGDIASNTMWMWQGAIGVSKYDGVISPSYNVYTQRNGDYDNNYLDFLLRTPPMVSAYRIHSTGITESRLRLYPENFLDLPFVVPPMDEQLKIVHFLSKKTRAINAQIEEEEHLIDRLTAYKQSLITETVTNGLHPESARKDSGVEWIGEIPETWCVHKMGWSYDIELGKMLDEKRIDTYNTKRYLRNSDVQWGYINLDDLNEMTFRPEELERYHVMTGDLLVCEGGEIGKCAIVPDDFPDDVYYQKALHRIRTREGQNGNVRFLSYVLFCMAKNQCFTTSSDKATIAHLTGEQLKATKVPFPPAGEQREIAAFLDAKCAAIDDDIAKRRALISRLSDYKRSMIYEVVTGKREV